MNKHFYVFLMISILALSSCHYDKEWQIINGNNKFSLALPSWVTESDRLAPGAEIQYANRFRNFYCIGMATDPKTDGRSFAAFTSSNFDSLKSHIKKPLITDSVSVTLNGLPGLRLEVYGLIDDEKIYFSELYVQGRNYYHISIWTRGESRKLKFKEDINHILESFKEL